MTKPTVGSSIIFRFQTNSKVGGRKTHLFKGVVAKVGNPLSVVVQDCEEQHHFLRWKYAGATVAVRRNTVVAGRPQRQFGGLKLLVSETGLHP